MIPHNMHRCGSTISTKAFADLCTTDMAVRAIEGGAALS
jgi:hypothetical protein